MVSCHDGPFNRPSDTSHDRQPLRSMARVASTSSQGWPLFWRCSPTSSTSCSALAGRWALFTFVATFVQAWYVAALYLFGGVGGLLALAWFAMTGRRFLTLEA